MRAILEATLLIFVDLVERYTDIFHYIYSHSPFNPYDDIITFKHKRNFVTEIDIV